MHCQGILSIINEDVKYIESKTVKRLEFKSCIPTPTQGHHFILKDSKGNLDYQAGLFRHILPEEYIIVIASQVPFMTFSIVPIKEGTFSMATMDKSKMEAIFTGIYPIDKCIITLSTLSDESASPYSSSEKA